MTKKSGVIWSLLMAGCVLSLWSSCKENIPDRSTLEFKQKEADAYVSFLAQYPDSAGLRLLAAGKLDSVGRYKDALLQLDTLIQSDSGKYAFWVVRANILLDSTDTTGAQNSYAKAIQLFPGQEALLNQAILYAYQKKDTCLKIAAGFTEDVVSRDYITALYAAQLMDTATAFAHLNRCIRLEHGYARAYETKAKLWLSLGDSKSALESTQQGLRAAPGNLSLLNLAGQISEATGKKDSARNYYQQSLFIKPFQPAIEQKIKSS
ncbi:MAG TPA: tetratricopeptide repeat protein [Arachidicoccus sp.]|nr:tetratricopeptide repeat protein [Arachidicoccus sp.]